MTNKAFERYCQAQDETGFKMATLIKEKSQKEGKVIPFTKKEGVTRG